MATERQVTCINKSDRTDQHERIHSIGGVFDNRRWTLSQQEAVRHIENGTMAFYVLYNNNRTNVIVAKSIYGHKYLRTEADSTTTNNLLSLPECP